MKNKTNPASQDEWTPERVRRMLTNPFYCIRVDRSFCEEHDFIRTEEQFVKAGVELIRREGAEVYIRNLLANLKGDSV